MGQREQASMPINRDAVLMIREGFAGSGLTQEALAQLTGIPRSTLANILSPTADPRLVHIDQFVRIAMALDVGAGSWAAALEDQARARAKADEVAARRARKAAPPPVQKRAARTRTGKPSSGKG
ncbi:helix-turn-helix domain-containing protein [Nocardioides stalactiti]|uniref:helix-turn-helix domain-containing protein n=1 Tax=Nocardioides stalactiti TaxID=2755356 RepID=UPI0015FFF136|nr:helix-turn-helix transcriptional regulator [Nocardioides stalactiti]